MSDERFGLVAGRYLLRHKLGHGGMGRVWLARDEMLDRDVAIKEVAPPAVLTPEENEQLRKLSLREARAAARINHPNVVKIYDVIKTEEWPWLVMEYIPSMTLQKTVEMGGPLPPDEVAKVGLSVLAALSAAHESGVLHRDVKPDNVLLCDDGRVVLSDFGLAQLDTDGTSTHTGHLGTPQYVAPERARHGTSSREADMWSLGATLYAAVEGRSPYGRESVLETLSALAVDDPDPLRLAGPMSPVLNGLLRRNPSDRLKSPQVLRMLTLIAKGETVPEPNVPPKKGPPDTRPLARPGASRRWTRLTAVGAGLAGVLAALYGLSLTRNDNTVSPPAGSSSPAPPPGIPTCEAPPRHTDRLPPLRPGQQPPRNHYVLPSDWSWFLELPNVALGVPAHWTYWRAGSTMCFRDPYGGRLMGVTPDAVRPEALSGFDLVERRNILLWEPAVEVEFTYVQDSRQRHAVALLTSGPTMFWVTDEFDFGASFGHFTLAKSAFQMTAGRPRR